MTRTIQDFTKRQKTLLTSTLSREVDGVPYLLGEPLTNFESSSFAKLLISMFLGKTNVSPRLVDLTDAILKLSVDHGPYVSGAVNTIVTARAGRDLVSSLVAGLLTIGPRFGGATNEAAKIFFGNSHKLPAEVIESFAKNKVLISGIGHKKYRIDSPDPRVAKLLRFADALKVKKHVTFALELQKITTLKKPNLILNVDGTIAALLLDYLVEFEGADDTQIKALIEAEFFNSIFIYARTAGFIAHYLDQKRLGEGLFRMPEDLVLTP